MKQCPFGIECESCRFYRDWILTDGKGKETVAQRCGVEVLFDEIPKLLGAIDGLQGGVNEARNRAIETRDSVEIRAGQFVDTIKAIAQANVRQIN